MKTLAITAIGILLSTNVGADPAGKNAAEAEPPEMVVNLNTHQSDRRVICRRDAPLGSRVLRKRCYVVDPDNHEVSMDDPVERQAFEILRDQQLFRDQLREQVFREEMLRRQHVIPSR
jgi:hypothetical protein